MLDTIYVILDTVFTANILTGVLTASDHNYSTHAIQGHLSIAMTTMKHPPFNYYQSSTKYITCLCTASFIHGIPLDSTDNTLEKTLSYQRQAYNWRSFTAVPALWLGLNLQITQH